MEHTDFDGIIFADTLQDFNALRHTGRVIHILCSGGNMGFTFQDTRYHIAAGDYVILPNATLGSDFSDSGDFQGIFMSLSDLFITSIAIRSNYGIIGHLSLLQNPVMKLSFHDFRVCKQAMLCIRERMEDKGHLFREELLGSLLTAHILDLYDIHARRREAVRLSEHITFLLRKFIELLYNGEYIRHRSLDFYASRLCITPHYLSEICKGEWQTCYLLDRSFYSFGNHSSAMAEGTLLDRDCRKAEFFLSILFQPICAEKNRNITVRVSEDDISGMKMVADRNSSVYLQLFKHTQIILMKNTISKGWLSLLIVMGILILDQIIKIAVKTNMYYNESIRITDWFYIHFVENPGMAFGMQVIPKAVQTIGRILFVFP